LELVPVARDREIYKGFQLNVKSANLKVAAREGSEPMVSGVVVVIQIGKGVA
jgi:hypothetical protein